MGNIGIILQGLAIFSIIGYVNYAIYQISNDTRSIEYKQNAYYTTIHNIVDNDFIKESYSFTGVVCSGTRTKCWNDNLPLFYDNNGYLKEKQVVYFVNSSLSFNFNSNDWYKNPSNIKELLGKLNKGVYIPRINELGAYNYIRSYKLYLNLIVENNKYETDWIISPFWFK